ncbi:MAG: Na+/H+ antiporter subunit B [Pseudomonadota bacterium]
MSSLILRVGTRYLAGILLLFSIYMLLRGHNQPGGGFIGGLIGSTGFVLYAIAWGTEDARKALRILPQNIAMAGLGIALLGGLGAAFAGEALFAGQWYFIGDFKSGEYIPLSTVLIFDVGVYLVVFGSILSLVFAMEEEI